MKEITIRLGHIDDVYAHMVEEFPANELKTYAEFVKLERDGRYDVLLAYDEQLIGYALVYKSKAMRALWLDFLAVLPSAQSKGYGTVFFESIINAYQADYDGMYLEVEIPEKDNVNQQRRITYYERLGAQILPMDYWLPTQDGAFAMYLMYVGKKEATLERTVQTIEDVFAYIHKSAPDTSHIIAKIKAQIV
ncbi:GNAT family N-acetyltransferase [Vallitaleaceae bacterium 9-2]